MSKRKPSSEPPQTTSRRPLSRSVLLGGAAVLGVLVGIGVVSLLGKSSGESVRVARPVARARKITRVSTAAQKPPSESPPGMVWIAAGEFVMGSDAPDAWPAERPAHRVRIDGFWIDATEVTNAEFQRFVDATKYVTTAEKPPVLEEIMKQLPPGTPPPPKEKLVAASLVFTPPDHSVKLDGEHLDEWWTWLPGADWRHPEGPDSNLTGREQHPVVQVSWDDAVAYARWAGKQLPTEAQWEFSARGGLEQKHFVWGDEPVNDKQSQANIWQGRFPDHNTLEDKFARTAPVKSFPANGYGLYDMAGNVWEWCRDWYSPETYRMQQAQSKGAVLENPTGPDRSFDPNDPYSPKRSERGGSFLCHASYCASYRPSARNGTTPDTSMAHLGFRCVVEPSDDQASDNPRRESPSPAPEKN